MNAFDYDLVIVGGGLVGGSLALALRNSPLRVAVIDATDTYERITAPSGQRALALARGSADVLDRLGIWSAIEPASSRITRIHVSDRGHIGKTRIDARQEGVAALGYVATASVIEAAIAEALPRTAAELIQPARVIGLQASEHCICVTLKQGDDHVHLTSRLVVAADGGNSSVRKLLDIGQTVRDYGQTAIVLEVATERDAAGTAYERFTPSGPLALLPIGRKRASVVWSLRGDDAEHVAGLPDDLFIASLQEAFGHWLGRLSLASTRQAFPLKLIQATRMTDQRVVLIGNALHQLHPVAGQGFNLGLRDAAQLAEALIRKTEFGEDIGDAQFLAGYAKARKQDLDRVIFFTDSLVRVFSSDFPPLALARNLGLLALDLWPGAKRLLARHAMGLGRRLPHLG
jgi:2-octaprenyl-6-methoxyphenol hydroxylase